jgi:hypothetical protein
MNIGAWASGFQPYGYKSVAFGTAITQGIDAADGKRLALIAGAYLPAGTAHLLQFMYAEDFPSAAVGSSRNTTSAGAAAVQKNVICTVAPCDTLGNVAAANDVVAYQCIDGTWEWNTVASLAGSTITMTNNLAKAVAAGAKIMIIGIAADLKSFNINTVASTERTFVEGQIMAKYMGEPLYFYSPNATATGFLQYLLFAYIDK